MALAESPGDCRWSAGFSATNAVPTFEAFTKPFTDRPGNEIAP